MLSILFTGVACTISAASLAFFIKSSKMRERTRQVYALRHELKLVRMSRDFLEANFGRYVTQGTLHSHLFFEKFGGIPIPNHLERKIIQVMQGNATIIELFAVVHLLKPSFEDYAGAHEVLVDVLMTNYFLNLDSVVTLDQVWPQAWDAYQAYESSRINQRWSESIRVLDRTGQIVTLR